MMTNKDSSPKLTLEIMPKALQQKCVASVLLGENGTLLMQYGDHVKVYENDTSAFNAAKLLRLVSSAL
ncbi:hypothetical protein [Vibrio parahaemolyticus]|uniref:hypothetical protein n=1 Tax=Vibrio parahaemolyticus TaxID=670 RepID=UPI0006B29231|nr:hypothetical protein [Vibrio parahaemolyticus]ELA7285356.1 hypothetical protein [Vibrio parahaemolyticus]KOY37403.1 hypothetical protein ACX08_06530 [Vibrio parahaemolyticus]MCR9875290.1 hypothetical protein [Vibrio parahaemolyticus]TOI25105.1 hypothetical protein CGI65_03370 [Vibrio parahaemolyticus]TOI79874.1 hypothetical protein CGI52_11640 [Vibrio parahaemolyticus]